jgi:SAM-dependent methyltransferase
MVAVARRRAEQAGLRNIECREADAEQLPFPDQTFDAVTCAYALMFCPDMDRAVAEVHRVLKPGGRAAFVVWDEPSKSPFVTAAGQSVAKFFPPAPPNPNAPGVFRLAEPGRLERLLRDGGFIEVAVESRPMTLECASADEYWRMFTDHAAGVKAKIAQLSAADTAALVAAVTAAVTPYLDGGRLRLVATPLCGSARR